MTLRSHLITLVLVAVFIPIFFMPGVIGLLFHEFAVTIGAAARRKVIAVTHDQQARILAYYLGPV